MNDRYLDCVVIGYNELPFERYENFLRNYGEESEAYRDLKFSFVNLGGKKLDYTGLLNYAREQAHPRGDGPLAQTGFKSGDIPNLAAVYLANFLRNRGYRAGYINLFQYEKEKLSEYLAADPLCVAITTTFYVVNLPIDEMVEFIRTHNPAVKIIVGGPLIANHARNNQDNSFSAALGDLAADIYVIEGQGEATLARIFRCSNSDEEAIDLMARSGCKGVFLGIESGSPTILVNMNKSATVEKYAAGIEMLRRYGIMTFGSFIIGFPGETDETVEETIDFIRETKPDYYRAQMWYCEPGTPIQNERLKYNIKGEGFVWSHATMDSLAAMDHIDRMFLTLDQSHAAGVSAQHRNNGGNLEECIHRLHRLIYRICVICG